MIKAEQSRRWSAEQYLRSGGRYIAAGFGAWLAYAAIASTISLLEPEGGGAFLLLLGFLLIPTVPLLFWFGYRRKHFGERLKAGIVPLRLADLESEQEPFVLYLRPFRLDGSRATFGDFKETVEQKIVNRLHHLGKVVCIGRPEEDLPHLGAARLYIPGDKWLDQQFVPVSSV